MSERQYRQGDVLIIPVPKGSRNPGAAIDREGGRVVLAHGEVTGHAHAIEDKACYLYVDDSSRISEADAMTMLSRLGGGLIPDRLLVCDTPVPVRHEEHRAFHLPADRDYIVRIQREYSPTELRNVAD